MTSLQIYVCIKHVPDTAANIRTQEGSSFDDRVKFIVNPYDENALEQALRIAEETVGTEVVAVTVGRPAAEATLRFALAMGADRGILVKTDTYFLDPLETSRLIREAIALDGTPGIIFTGRQAIDVEGMQIPFRLAFLFDMPVVINAVTFSMAAGVVTVARELEGDIEVIEMTMPCIVGAAKGLNQPRSPTLPDMMKARKKPIKVIGRADLDIQIPPASVEMLAIQSVPDRGRGLVVQDSPEEMVRQLLAYLKKASIFPETAGQV